MKTILWSLLILNFLIYVITAALPFSYQTVKIELFMDNDDEDDSPCQSPDNYTLIFKDMRIDSATCTSKLFPQLTSSNSQEKWMQFSAKTEATSDGGLKIWLYFTRNDLTGAITYCSEENILNLPYPLLVSANQSTVCRVLDLPDFDPYGSAEDDHSLALKVTYDVDSVRQFVESQS
jgi:hypothetical protein